MATLFIVPTPIGNLKDITYRAVETLKNVSLIAAEDTRNSVKLLKYYDIDTPMISYHKFNERKRTDTIIKKLQSGEDVALISDAGTPGISDPASIIINEAIAAGIDVETLPGSTALIPPLVSSGLNCEKFLFAGFLSEKSKLRDESLKRITEYPETLIFYEAPHRLNKTLKLLYHYFGNRKVVIGREISKIFENYLRTDLKTIIDHPEDLILKGEFVIIVEGKKSDNYTDEQIIKMLKRFFKQGTSLKTAVKEISEKILENKNRIYKIALKIYTKK